MNYQTLNTQMPRLLTGVRMAEKDKTRTTIDVDRKVWTEIRQEAYQKGVTVSEVVERRLAESVKKKSER